MRILVFNRWRWVSWWSLGLWILGIAQTKIVVGGLDSCELGSRYRPLQIHAGWDLPAISPMRTLACPPDEPTTWS